MLHLFKRVYLELDNSIDLNVNRYVISKENGGALLNDLQAVVYAQLLDNASTIDELIGPGKKFENFLTFLNELNRQVDVLQSSVVIYCDKEAYLQIACTWLKIVLPNITMDDAYGIVASNLFQTRMLGTSELADFTRPYRSTMVDRFVTIQEFNQYYSTISVNPALYAGFVNLVRSGLSLEFVLASYLVNGSYKEELKAVAHNQIKIGMQLFLYECKTFIIESLLNKQIIDQFSPTVEYTFSNLEQFITDPAFDVWFEPSIWGVQSVGVPHSKSLIYFDRLTNSQVDKLTAHLAIWIQQFNGGAKPGTMGAGDDLNSWFAEKIKNLGLCRKASLSDTDLAELIAVQMGREGSIVEFSLFESVQQSKFSIYVTEHIRQMYIANKESRLLPFTLV